MIRASNLTREFTQGDERILALKDFSLTVAKGEFVALMGESGAGKSTLLQILGCLDVPSSGDYFLDGERVSALDETALARIRNRTVGFVFQTSHFVDYLNLLDNVALPGFYRDQQLARHRQRGAQLLDQVGLGHRFNHRPAELSGGEKQRAAIARALFNEPQLILADEPTGNLDRANSEQITALFQKLHQQGLTILMVTHDQRVAACAQRIVQLSAQTSSEINNHGR